MSAIAFYVGPFSILREYVMSYCECTNFSMNLTFEHLGGEAAAAGLSYLATHCFQFS